ncbi:MAG: hypothetical protein ACKVOT_08295 [Polaromonas sp.]
MYINFRIIFKHEKCLQPNLAVRGQLLKKERFLEHSGPGYRVYCWKDGLTVVVALGGGDKSSQDRDIAKAQHMVTLLKE